MTATSRPPTIPRVSCAAEEARDIHLAVCRARRQGLVCSTCCELVVRAARQSRAVTS